MGKGGRGVGVLRALLGLLEAGGEGALGNLILPEDPLQYLFEQEVFLLNSWEQPLKSEVYSLKCSFYLSHGHRCLPVPRLLHHYNAGDNSRCEAPGSGAGAPSFLSLLSLIPFNF